MFAGWDSYFLLIGGAAGALIGLLFVVAGLTSGLQREDRLRGASLYLSPVVFHFAVVLVVSGAALAPRLSAPHMAIVVGVCALAGLVHLAYVTAGIASRRTPAPPHWSDVWCYGVGPLGLYAALAGAAWAVWAAASWAAYAVAAAGMALLLIGVRNAWDLVTWLAPAPTDAQPPQG